MFPSLSIGTLTREFPVARSFRGLFTKSLMIDLTRSKFTYTFHTLACTDRESRSALPRQQHFLGSCKELTSKNSLYYSYITLLSIILSFLTAYNDYVIDLLGKGNNSAWLIGRGHQMRFQRFIYMDQLSFTPGTTWLPKHQSAARTGNPQQSWRAWVSPILQGLNANASLALNCWSCGPKIAGWGPHASWA